MTDLDLSSAMDKILSMSEQLLNQHTQLQTAFERWSTSYTVYAKECQRILNVIQQQDHIHTILKTPQLIQECIVNDRWDDALLLYEQIQLWQQQVDIYIEQYDEERVLTGAKTLLAQLYQTAQTFIKQDLLPRLIMRLSSDATLPALAHYQSQLYRIWDILDTLDEQPRKCTALTQYVILRDCCHQQLLRASLITRARVAWWQQTMAKSGHISTLSSDMNVEKSMTLVDRINATRDVVQQRAMDVSAQSLVVWLDAVRQHTPALYRQLAVLLTPLGKQAGHQLHIATGHVVDTLRSALTQCLANTNDLTWVTTLITCLNQTTRLLARYGMNLLPTIQHDIDAAMVRIVTQRMQDAVTLLSDELKRDTVWWPTHDDAMRILTASTLTLEDLVDVAPLARLTNRWLMILDALRCCTPNISIWPALMDCVQSTLQQSSDAIYAALSQANQPTIQRTVARLFAKQLVPYFWQSLEQHVFTVDPQLTALPVWSNLQQRHQAQASDSLAVVHQQLSAWLIESTTDSASSNN
jgi:hypothetical protein